MRTRTGLAGLMGTFWVLACAGVGDASAVFEDYSVPLTEPWSSLALPVGDGAVIYSDEAVLTVLYDEGEAGTLAQAYTAAFASAGYAVSDEQLQDDQSQATLTLDEDSFTLLALSDDGAVTLHVSED